MFAGVAAARKRDSKLDRFIVMGGLATSSIPEFVTGALLVILFGVFLHWLPVISTIPSGTSMVGQLRYLILPALAMAIVYFGYIARMMRAGTIKALESDYVRTATMKGINERQLIRGHVIRNAVPPTITVISVQVGYLFGGIIAVEKVFNYSGIGQQVAAAVAAKDLPLLQGCVLIVGTIYMLATLLADILIAWLNPRVRLTGRYDVNVAQPPTLVSERKNARRENWRLLRRKPGFIIGILIVAMWVVCAVVGSRIAPHDAARDLDVKNLSPRRDHLFGTDIIGRDVFSRVIVGSRNILLIAPVAAGLSIIAGTTLGLLMGYYRGAIDTVLSRIVETFLALPVVLVGLLALVTFGSSRVVVIAIVAILFTPIVTRTVRSAVLAEAISTTSRRRVFAANRTCSSCRMRSCRTSAPSSSSSSP